MNTMTGTGLSGKTPIAGKAPSAGTAPRERLIRIGEVVRRLGEEFPDISISKIRFLEDEGLLSPQRTRGGYRLFSEDDVERLVTILRLQRDEFLPLRVIRDELAVPGASERKRRRPAALGERLEEIDFDELCRRSGVKGDLVKELDDFGLLSPTGSGADKRYPETDVDITVVCSQLTRFGVDARHLRTFRTATDREAALLEQLIAPALRSRNNERRASGLADLQALAELAQELAGLLLWGKVREIGSA
jgi:DNA-binding transcriptional MerR regulator